MASDKAAVGVAPAAPHAANGVDATTADGPGPAEHPAGCGAWVSKVAMQTDLLVRKNVHLLRRSPATTATQFLLGFFLLLLIALMEAAINANQQWNERFTHTEVPSIDEVPLLQPCTPGPAAGATCDAFLFTPDTGPIRDLVGEVIHGSDIPAIGAAGGPVGFADEAAVDAYLVDNPNTTALALHFRGWPVTQYVIQANTTANCKFLGVLRCTDPWMELVSASQVAVDSAVLRLFGTEAEASIEVGLQSFPHPDHPWRFDASTAYLSGFMYICMCANIVFQVLNMVREKELHLREAMTQVGLLDVSYWISWFVTNTGINLVLITVLILTGLLFDNDWFHESAFGLTFFSLLLGAMAMSSLGVVFAALARNASAARNIVLVWFIISFNATPILGLIYYKFADNADSTTARTILSFFPNFPAWSVWESLVQRSAGDSQTGLAWDERDEDVLWFTAEDGLLWLLADIAILGALGWYLDNVIPNEYGVRKPLYFFLQPSYWRAWGDDGTSSIGDTVLDPAVVVLRDDDEEDVKEEAERVKDEIVNRPAKPAAVYVAGLRKTFKRVATKETTVCGMCKRKTKVQESFNACDDLSLAIEAGALTVLLGENGAGKSTLINVLTGLMPLTSGDMTVFGLSVRKDMQTINRLMGICPQHDVLFDTMTAREHIELFAKLKGVVDIEAEVKTRLSEVHLDGVEMDIIARNYSGGMRRRLSLAIAFVGNPRLVVLDEPTTGMDPVNRRAVWNLIERKKREGGMTILLTSHAMEEADVLGDRIVVMFKGRIKAIGSSIRLKSKFGAGFRCTIFTESSEEAKEKLRKFVDDAMPGSKLISAIDGCLQYQVPPRDDAAETGAFFGALDDKREELKISDYSVSLVTLEEVFINVTRRAQREAEAREKKEDGAAASSAAAVEPAAAAAAAAGGGEGGGSDGASDASGAVAVDVPLDAATPQAPEVRSDAERAAFKLSFAMQARALFAKNIAYQKRQKGQICALACFPLIVISLLLLLQVLVFDPLSSDAVDGIDLDCVADAFTQTVEYTPEPIAGDNECTFTGFRTAADCVPYEFKDYSIPFAQSDASGNPVAYSGRVGYEPAAELRAWWIGLMATGASVQECADAFNNAIGEGGVSYENAWDWMETYPEEWRNMTEFAGRLPPQGFAGAGACATSDSGDASDADNPADRFRPQQATLDAVAALSETRDACEAEKLSSVLAEFDPTDVDLAALIAGVQTVDTTPAAPGFMAHVSSAGWADDNIGVVELLMVQGAVSALAAFDVSIARTNQTLQYLCDEYAIAMGAVLGQPTTANLCRYRSAIDKVRGLAMVPAASNSAMLSALMESYYGTLEDGKFMSSWTAMHLKKADEGSAQYAYTALFNHTLEPGHQNRHVAINFFNSAILKEHIGTGITFAMKTFPVVFRASMLDPLGGLSFIDFIASGFLPYVLLMISYSTLSIVVLEKEKRMRMAMVMGGLPMSVYWVVTYIIYVLEFFAMAAMLWIYGGAIVGMATFSLHDPGILLLMFVVWGNVVVMWSFLLSTFFSNQRAATAFAFLMMLVCVEVGGQVLIQMILDPNSRESSFSPLMWIPPVAMVRMVFVLALSGAFQESITFDNWWDVADGAVPVTLTWLGLSWFVMLLLFLYLDAVIPVSWGVKRHPLFCLRKSFWQGLSSESSGDDSDATPATDASARSVGDGEAGLTGDDVIAERRRVFAKYGPADADKEPFVKIKDLRKVFHVGGAAGDKVAVDRLSLGINKHECLGLLGSNGAGKSTTMNMLVGLYGSTGGDATINKLSINNEDVQNRIHRQLGVCAQDNLLWDSLTAREHCQFFGRLKGLDGSALDAAVEHILRRVGLTKFGDTVSGGYSGGMKRRLSVACALVGHPLLTCLDECSTGLDPASRQALWSTIVAAKQYSTLALTTHAMEEAEALCDRIAIMAYGKLQCIGTAAQLKRRFGAGYTVVISHNAKREAAVAADAAIAEFIVATLPSATLLAPPIGGLAKFQVAREDVKLSELFVQLETNKERLHVTDWGVSDTTLDEVFTAIVARADGFDHAAATKEVAAVTSLAEGDKGGEAEAKADGV